MKKHRKSTELNQLIDRVVFDELVERWSMDKWVRGFKTWEMTCALITAMIMRLGSYREVEQALGIPRATLGDAMVKRFSGFFTELCDQILLDIRGRSADRKVKRAIRQILAFDSSEIRVHGSLFTSPGWQQKSAHGHLAVAKIHVMWDVEGKWIDDYLVTGGRLNDSPVSRLFELKSGVTYVFDRAYSDIGFWIKIRKVGSDFVTRLRGLSIKRLPESKIAERQHEDGVLYDGIYRPCRTSIYTVPKGDRTDLEFRYIVYRDPLTKRIFYFVTSDWSARAQTIADIYKRRWAIELLFRWLKGHLDVRYLASKTKNAVRIQIAIAVLVHLLLRLKKIKDLYKGTLWGLLRAIRITCIRQTLAVRGAPDGCRWKHHMSQSSTNVYF